MKIRILGVEIRVGLDILGIGLWRHVGRIRKRYQRLLGHQIPVSILRQHTKDYRINAHTDY